MAFGPTPRDFSKKVNKKVTKLALKRAFSERVAEERVVVLDKFDLPDHKTRNAQAVLNNLKLNDDSVLLTVPEYEESVYCATHNLPYVLLRKAASVNVYELLRFKTLVFTKDALDAFLARLG